MNLETSETYSPRNAATLARFSDWAYGSEDAIQRLFLNGTMQADRCQFIESKETDTQLFVAQDRFSITISARGTSDKKQMLTDLRVAQIKTDKMGSVHTGFYLDALSVFDRTMAVIQRYRDNSQKVYFDGHSLGGSNVSIIALLAAQAGLDVSGVYTYGKPRTGNAEFVSIYNAALGKVSYRLVDKEDFIPHIPSFFGEYRQDSTEVFFDEDNQCIINPHFWQNNEMYSILQRWKHGQEGVYAMLDDHHMAKYLQLVATEI